MNQRPKLGRNVIALGVVSLLTDVSSEMIYPLLPVFLTATLGVSASALGVIEGAAESTASLLRLASGWWSDRVTSRKPLVVLGYTIATVMRPLVAIAQTATHVLAIRVTDRVGKGIRTSPRDALIADSIDESIRGRAYGFHRAMDHAGAVIGPLAAFALLNWIGLEIRAVFWAAAVPGMLAVLALVVFVRETRPAPADKAPAKEVAGVDVATQGALPRSFWAYLGIVFVFTLGSSTDAFLLLRANQLGVPIAMTGVLWAVHHAAKSALSTWGGAMSDRYGRMRMMLVGWIIYAAAYYAFAAATAAWHVWILFIAYAAFFALTEGAERALVADLAPAARRGAAFGWFHLTVGLGALPASVLFGVIWDRYGSAVAFQMGAAIALLASVLLAALMATQGRARTRQS